MSISNKTRRKRLRKLASQIVKHEDQFYMGSYFEDHTSLSGGELIKKILEKRRPICGTSGCAAGWAVFMFGTKKQIASCIRRDDRWDSTAKKLLGMTNEEAYLFGSIGDGAEDIAKELRQMAKA